MNLLQDCYPIMVAEDDEISRMFLIETLGQAGFATVAVADGAAALEALATKTFSLVLLDVDMPGYNGYEVCRFVRQTKHLQHLPVVIITGLDDGPSITQAYEAGATDFISKPVNWTLLPHRIRYILRNADADRRLRALAYHDPLTGLPNAQCLVNLVEEAVAEAGRAGCEERVALVHLGIEGCDRIRSIFGPNLGDTALQAFAARLTTIVSEGQHAPSHATVARIEGDRFAICVRSREIGAVVAELVARIKLAFAEPLPYADHQFFLEPAIGVAFCPDHGTEPLMLLTHAAAARLHALQSDTSEAVTYSHELGNRARERMTLESALRDAIRTEQLVLYFQPKIDVMDGSVVGVEALIRWFHPDLGEISPVRFIPLAEESGLILDLGNWVIQAACRQLMNWQHCDFHTAIAINISPLQFLHDDPAARLAKATTECGIDPHLVTVEITESALMTNLSRVNRGLNAVRSLGCRIAIDDFGTGYSSLAYLKSLPIDELKIDRSFVRSLGTDSADEAICAAVLSLARTLGHRVTAEGVETHRQLEWLRRNQCNEAQGFLIARPMPAREVIGRHGAGGLEKVHQGAA